MRTDANIARSRLGSATLDLSHAENIIASMAQDVPNTIDVIQLLYAATLCALAQTQIKAATHTLREVTQK